MLVLVPEQTMPAPLMLPATDKELIDTAKGSDIADAQVPLVTTAL